MVNKVNKVNVSGCVRLKYIYVSIMYPDLSTWSSDVCGCICRMYKFFILKSNISLWIFFLIKQERRSCIIRKKQLFLSQEIVSQCTRENNLYFYPLRQFYNTHTVFVNNKYVKTVTVTGCINFSFKKAIYLCEFFSNQTRKTILYHPRSASSEAVWASFAKSFSPFFLLILTWQDPDHYWAFSTKKSVKEKWKFKS